MQKKIYLTDLEENSTVTISCTLNNKTAEFLCTVAQVFDKYVYLNIPTVEGKALSFDNVNISIIATSEDGQPYRFSDCAIVFFKGHYVAQSKKEGLKINRRGSFRVGVSVPASMIKSGARPVNVYMRDVSASGFSITTDRELEVGEVLTVHFDDMGLRIQLTGKIVRMEQVEEGLDKIVYGLQTINPNPVVDSYINAKQRDILRRKRQSTRRPR